MKNNIGFFKSLGISFQFLTAKKFKEVEFTKIKLPCGKEATINECFGRHYFAVVSQSFGDAGIFMSLLIVQLTFIDGKQLTLDELYEMRWEDVNVLTLAVNTMLEDLNLSKG